MDEITLFTVVRPAAPEFADDERGHARGLLLAAAAAERTTGSRGAAGDRRRRRWPRRLIAIPVAAALAAAALVVALAHPGDRAGTPGIGPLRPDLHALAFTISDGYITVIVRDPVADQASYNAEFKAHGLDITLSLVPVSPSLVGTVVEISTDGPDGNSIATITAEGKCWTGGGGNECPVGLRIPDGYRGQAAIVFGRAARPGEQYESTAPVDAPGEAMYGLKFRYQTVASVLAMLRLRHVTALFQDFETGAMLGPKAPATWYVYDGVPWAPGRVLLRVGQSRTGGLYHTPVAARSPGHSPR
jgi:hypothetical protein